MIRDRIVVGLRDANLSMKLQMVSDLSLEKAVTIARQSEAVWQQQSIVRGEPGVVDSVDSHKKEKMCKTSQAIKTISPVQTPPSTKPPQKQTCTSCGKFAYSRQKLRKLHTWKWILMTKIHTWKWVLMFFL